jgi:hypothetical protein
MSKANEQVRGEKIALRPKDVVELSGISKAKVSTLISSGRIKSRLIDGCRIVLRADLIDFLHGAKS